MRHRQRRLDETGNPGGRLEVTEVGLHRPQGARVRTLVFAKAIGGSERLEFDGIAQHRSSAVGLDIVDAVGGRIGQLQRRADHITLRCRVRRGHAVGSTVLVDRRAPDHCQHAVAIADGVDQPLEHHDPAAFTADEPVGQGVEGFTPAGR